MPDHTTGGSERKMVACPICGAEFQCSRSLDCWCVRKIVPAAVTEYLAARYDTCVCSNCLERLIGQSEAESPDAMT
ncbi:MAG: cysteine-rich CWC family protein [Chlorobi bacterium]|nr:cysteine-rich CWC family protein [Chlorobiota bacterium]